MSDAGDGQRVERRAWFWAFSQLVKPKPGLGASVSRLKLRIAETVLYESNGEAVLWLFTSKDGDVLRRDRKRLKLDTIVETVQKHARQDALEAGSRPSQTYAACVRKGNESAPEVKALLLTEAELLEQGKEGGGLTGGLMALQVPVHPRGGGGTRYRCEAAVGPDGKSMRYTTTKLAYLGAPTDADAPHPRSSAGASLGVGRAFSIKCTMNSFNDDLAKRTAAIIYHLNEVGRTKVVKLQADFILSAATDEPTLVSLPLVNTTPLPKPPPRFDSLGSFASSAALPAASSVTEGGGILHAPGGMSYSTLPKVPTDPAVISRLVRSASLPVVAPDSGLAGKSPLTLSPPHLRNKGGKKDSSADAHARPAPWLRLHPPIAKGFASDKRRPKSHVCLGDFCNVPVHAIQKEDDEEWARANVSEDDGPGSRRGFKRSGSARRRRSMDEDAAEPEEAPGAPPKGMPLYQLPYRSLLQARAERAVAGDDSAIGKSADGGALRSALLLQGKPGRPHPNGPMMPTPAEFYQSVLVCHSCYVVYCRMDAARAHTEQPFEEAERPRSPQRSTPSRSPPRASSPPPRPRTEQQRAREGGGGGGMSSSSSAATSERASARSSRIGSAQQLRRSGTEPPPGGSSSLGRLSGAPAAVMEEEGKDGEGKRGGAAGSGQSSGMRPNSAKDGEGEAGGGGGARGRLHGGMGGMPRSATHAGTLVRSTSASALGRGLPGSSGLVRYGSGLGFDLFGGVAGGVQFDRGRGGRRQLRAPHRLAELNRDDGRLGPKQVKRLLAELERRPQSALPHQPAIALDTGKASAVARALAGAIGADRSGMTRAPPSAYELTAMPPELAMMGAALKEDEEYLRELQGLAGDSANGGGALLDGIGFASLGALPVDDDLQGRQHLQMIMASRSAANLGGVCVGGGGGSSGSSARNSARGSAGAKLSHGTAKNIARGGGSAGSSGGRSDPSLYDLAGQAPGDLGNAFGTSKPVLPEKPANSETMFARQPKSPPKSPPRSRPGTGSRVSFGAAPA